MDFGLHPPPTTKGLNPNLSKDITAGICPHRRLLFHTSLVFSTASCLEPLPPLSTHTHTSLYYDEISRCQAENFRGCNLGNLGWLEVNKRVGDSSLNSTAQLVKILSLTRSNVG